LTRHDGVDAYDPRHPADPGGPGAGGAKGIGLAGALGFYDGDPARKLEVLEPVHDASLAKTQSLVATGKVAVNLIEGRSGIYIRSTLKAGSNEAEAVVESTHDNLVGLRRDGQPVKDHPLLSNTVANKRKTDRTILQIMIDKPFSEEPLAWRQGDRRDSAWADCERDSIPLGLQRRRHRSQAIQHDGLPTDLPRYIQTPFDLGIQSEPT